MARWGQYKPSPFVVNVSVVVAVDPDLLNDSLNRVCVCCWGPAKVETISYILYTTSVGAHQVCECLSCELFSGAKWACIVRYTRYEVRIVKIMDSSWIFIKRPHEKFAFARRNCSMACQLVRAIDECLLISVLWPLIVVRCRYATSCSHIPVNWPFITKSLIDMTLRGVSLVALCLPLMAVLIGSRCVRDVCYHSVLLICLYQKMLSLYARTCTPPIRCIEVPNLWQSRQLITY